MSHRTGKRLEQGARGISGEKGSYGSHPAFSIRALDSLKFVSGLLASLTLTLALSLFGVQSALAQESVLEKYVFSHGGTPGDKPDGVEARLHDKYFGSGTAKAHIRLKSKGELASLSLDVFRDVKPGHLTLALLVSRVEIRGYDLSGVLLYSRDLDGFSFGDSRSGDWSEDVDDIPANAQQISIIFVGNYA